MNTTVRLALLPGAIGTVRLPAIANACARLPRFTILKTTLPSGTALEESAKAPSEGLPAVTRTVTVPAPRAASAGATAGEARTSARMRRLTIPSM